MNFIKTTIRIKASILALVAVLLLLSCSGKKTPVEDLRVLCEDLQQNSSKYTEDEWTMAVNYFDEISHDIDSYHTEYTPEEWEEIGRLKGECVAYLTRNAVDHMSNRVKETMYQIKGGLRGINAAMQDMGVIKDSAK